MLDCKQRKLDDWRFLVRLTRGERDERLTAIVPIEKFARQGREPSYMQAVWLLSACLDLDRPAAQAKAMRNRNLLRNFWYILPARGSSCTLEKGC